jgi:hypothetical protein
MVPIIHTLTVFLIAFAVGWIAKKHFASPTPDRDPEELDRVRKSGMRARRLSETEKLISDSLFHTIQASASLNNLAYAGWNTKTVLSHLELAKAHVDKLHELIEAKRITDDLVPDTTEIDQIERGV